MSLSLELNEPLPDAPWCSFVFVHDPTDAEVIPVGKQTRNPSHIFYRSCSGIWQTVWLERAPANHITQLDVSAGMDGEGMSRVFFSLR